MTEQETVDIMRRIEALKRSETPKSSERAVEATQADHIADSGKKVERTAETAQNTSSSCAHENDVRRP